MINLKPVQKTRTAGTIIEQILSLVRSGKLKAGDRLPSEADLMRQTGVGRPSVRSALHSLEALNIVEIRQGVGAFVRVVDIPLALAEATKVSKLFSKRSIMEAIAIRLMLEPGIAAAAAREAAGSDLERLHGALQALKKPKRSNAYLKDEHIAFHLSIAESTHNLLLARLEHFLLSLWEEGVERALHPGSAYRSHVEQIYGDHLLLYDAIASGDHELAYQRTLEHISATKDRISQLQDSASPGGSPCEDGEE